MTLLKTPSLNPFQEIKSMKETIDVEEEYMKAGMPDGYDQDGLAVLFSARARKRSEAEDGRARRSPRRGGQELPPPQPPLGGACGGDPCTERACTRTARAGHVPSRAADQSPCLTRTEARRIMARIRCTMTVETFK